MAIRTNAVEAGIYLYGITVAQDAVPVEVPGVEKGEVEQIAEGSLAAVVTRVTTHKIRPQRANLAAHHHVLRDLADRDAVLPFVFGTIAAGQDELRDILRANRDVLLEQLQRLRGKVEMGLKVFWETANIFEYFVATHQELEAMRNRLFRPGRQSTLEERIELGRLFGALLEQSRRRHTRRVTEALATYCAEIRTVDPGEERMIMKLACLVDKDRQQQWEEGVHHAARQFDDHYRFEYNGPWPAYNFAHIDLESGTVERSAAKSARGSER